MSDESVKPFGIDTVSAPKPNNYSTKTRVEFTGIPLKQDKITYIQGTIVKIYIVYEITKKNSISSYPKLENCLFGAAKLTKNPDI